MSTWSISALKFDFSNIRLGSLHRIRKNWRVQYAYHLILHSQFVVYNFMFLLSNANSWSNQLTFPASSKCKNSIDCRYICSLVVFYWLGFSICTREVFNSMWTPIGRRASNLKFSLRMKFFMSIIAYHSIISFVSCI